MSGHKAAAGVGPVESVAWQVGRQLALQLLDEAYTVGLDEMALPADCRDGRPQTNLVLTYLAKVDDCRDTRVRVAFAAVLSDFIAGAVDGGAPDISALREWSRHPVPQAAQS